MKKDCQVQQQFCGLTVLWWYLLVAAAALKSVLPIPRELLRAAAFCSASVLHSVGVSVGTALTHPPSLLQPGANVSAPGDGPACLQHWCVTVCPGAATPQQLDHQKAPFWRGLPSHSQVDRLLGYLCVSLLLYRGSSSVSLPKYHSKN